ncbi:MAG: right-handed parallel beta-helix repeat-containing protein [Candidatus Binataceae bacterium]
MRRCFQLHQRLRHHAINTAGCYELTGALSATTAGQTCITIGTSNVLLKFNGHSINGPGSTSTGVGIRVLPNFVNSKAVTVAVSNVRIEGEGQYVSSFKVGVLVGKPTSTPGPNHITIDNLNAQSNVADGIQLINTSLSVVSADSADYNLANGIEIDAGSKSNLVTASTANSNKVYGIWLYSASGNELAADTAESNALAGIFLGCTTKGPGSATTCKSLTLPGSDNNQLDSDTTDYNGTTGKKGWGIALDSGCSGNSIEDASSTSNVSYDLYDQNVGCDSNTWFGDVFSAANNICID